MEKRKGLNQIDFAIAVFVIITTVGFSVSYVTNYLSHSVAQAKSAELRTTLDNLGRVLFESAGISENWENLNYTPVRIGLKASAYKISIMLNESGGVNRTNESTDIHIIFDNECRNKTYNNTVRIYDRFLNTVQFKISNITECATGFLKEANVGFSANQTANQSTVYWLFFSNNTNITNTSFLSTIYEPSLVGYWKLESANSTNHTLDETLNRNDGKLGNGSAFTAPQFVSGKIGNALNFDGADDYVNVASLADAGVTIGYWKKNSTDSAWFHVANVSGNLYVNGVAGSGQKIYVTNVSGNVVIGKDSSGNYFSGLIDEVRIYNRSLSTDEVKAHYYYTMPKYLSAGSVPVVSYFKVNATQKLSYDNMKSSLGLQKHFNATICGYSFGKALPEVASIAASQYPLLFLNYTGEIKACLASISVW